MQQLAAQHNKEIQQLRLGFQETGQSAVSSKSECVACRTSRQSCFYILDNCLASSLSCRRHTCPHAPNPSPAIHSIDVCLGFLQWLRRHSDDRCTAPRKVRLDLVQAENRSFKTRISAVTGATGNRQGLTELWNADIQPCQQYCSMAVCRSSARASEFYMDSRHGSCALPTAVHFPTSRLMSQSS